MEPLYRLLSVRKRYDHRAALEVGELTIREGAAYTLTGPNGSGKSTLLHILAFLLPPTSGDLFYAGEKVLWTSKTLAGLRKEVTLLHQSPYLFHGTVSDNVGFGLQVRGIASEERRRRTGEVLEAVGLSGFENRKAKELSGGEAQRVAMARALAIRPRVLLLDEPLANVDRGSSGILVEVIASLPRRGTTVVTATHDPALPGKLECEVLRLEEGKFAEAPAPDDEGTEYRAGVFRHAHV